MATRKTLCGVCGKLFKSGLPTCPKCKALGLSAPPPVPVPAPVMVTA